MARRKRNNNTSGLNSAGQVAPAQAEDTHLDISMLETWLWDAACAIRGATDAPKFKDFILPLVFFKRLSDVFEDERNWVHFPVYFRGALHTYLTCQTISCMYLGISGTLAVNRSMPILYGSARLLPERERLKYDLKPSLADLRPTFQQDWDLCRSSLHVGWPGGPGRSLILKQICSGLLKAPLLKGRGSLQDL